MVNPTRGFGAAASAAPPPTDAERKSIEAEIQQLQRNFRVLENDKRNYSEVSQGVIRKQRATIMKLSRENKKMKQELNDTRAFTSSKSEHKLGTERLHRIEEEKDRVDARLRDEAARGKVIDDRIGVLEDKIRSLREELARRGGINAAKETDEAIEKQVKVLDNRLEKNLQKFNEVIAVNTRLRDRIDTLRRERVVFDSIYRKLEIELQEKKKEMANIIEQANAAYEARDQAQAQMTALKQQADREHHEFEKEWKELGRLIENDKKMKDFIRQKERSRIEDSGKSGNSDVLALDNLNDEMGTTEDKADIRMTADKIEVYDEAFSKIQSATGITDINELVQNFITAEDQNFSLLNYANQLSEDIKKLEASITDLTREFDSLKVDESPPGKLSTGKRPTTDAVSPEFLSQLERKWNKADRKAESYELRYQQALNTLTGVRAGIQSIFNFLGCDPPPLAVLDDFEDETGSHGLNEAVVSESAMLSYLGVIEKAVNEILRVYAASQVAVVSEETGEADYAIGDKYLMPKAVVAVAPASSSSKPNDAGTSSAFMTIKLPSTIEDYSDDSEMEDDDEDDDDDQRPFTREELKARSKRDIAKRREREKKMNDNNRNDGAPYG